MPTATKEDVISYARQAATRKSIPYTVYLLSGQWVYADQAWFLSKASWEGVEEILHVYPDGTIKENPDGA